MMAVLERIRAEVATFRGWSRVRYLVLALADAVEQGRVVALRRIADIKPQRRRAIFHGLLIGGYVGFLLLVLRGTDPYGWDAYAYWSLDVANPYGGAYGTSGYFPYSPAAAQMFAAAGWLPWPVFLIGWTALLASTLVWLGGRATIFLLAFPPIAGEIYTGNIHVLLGAAMVLGFRWPAAWAFVLLTKVTPGVGLLWFAVRREWRSLAVALGVTAGIALLSMVLLPAQWAAWVSSLLENAGSVAQPVPLWLRLPLAALVVSWGALKQAPWTVPIAATIAAPVTFFISLSMLAACWPLRYGLPARTAGRHAGGAALAGSSR